MYPTAGIPFSQFLVIGDGTQEEASVGLSKKGTPELLESKASRPLKPQQLKPLEQGYLALRASLDQEVRHHLVSGADKKSGGHHRNKSGVIDMSAHPLTKQLLRETLGIPTQMSTESGGEPWSVVRPDKLIQLKLALDWARDLCESVPGLTRDQGLQLAMEILKDLRAGNNKLTTAAQVVEAYGAVAQYLVVQPGMRRCNRHLPRSWRHLNWLLSLKRKRLPLRPCTCMSSRLQRIARPTTRDPVVAQSLRCPRSPSHHPAPGGPAIAVNEPSKGR